MLFTKKKHAKRNVPVSLIGLFISLMPMIACASKAAEAFWERGIRYYYNGDYDSAVNPSLTTRGV